MNDLGREFAKQSRQQRNSGYDPYAGLYQQPTINPYAGAAIQQQASFMPGGVNYNRQQQATPTTVNIHMPQQGGILQGR